MGGPTTAQGMQPNLHEPHGVTPVAKCGRRTMPSERERPMTAFAQTDRIG